MISALDRAHRSDLGTLAALAQRDLATLWRQVDDAQVAKGALVEILPRLVEIYATAAASLAADYYDESREDAGARGRYRAAPAIVTLDESLDVAASVAVGPLFAADPDWDAATTLARGALQFRVARADRETVRQSAIEDPQAQGWRRVGSRGCAWCRKYLNDEVHTTAGIDFQAHDHCRCTAVPVF